MTTTGKTPLKDRITLLKLPVFEPLLFGIGSCVALGLFFFPAIRIFGFLCLFLLLVAAVGVICRNEKQVRTLFLVAVYAAVAAFYAFTAISSGPFDSTLPSRAPVGHYNALVSSLLQGSLAMPLEVSPELLSLPDPYDFHAREKVDYAWDLSLYKGKYYLYFGITPVVFLYLPFRLLTGWYLPDCLAALVFSLLAFFFTALLVRNIIRRWYTGADAFFWEMSATACAGFATFVPFLLRRPDVYEVAILSAVCCAAGGVFLFLRTAETVVTRRKIGLAVFGSFLLACAVGSRPPALALSLVIPLYLLEESGWNLRRIPRILPLIAAAVLPFCLYGVLLALYNFLRFDSLAEFGLRYQLTGFNWTSDLHFSLRNGVAGMANYLLRMPSYTAEFPYWRLVQDGFSGIGHGRLNAVAVGVVWALPMVWALPALVLLMRKIDRWGRSLAAFFCASAVVMAAFFSGYIGIIVRFEAEFALWLLLASLLTFLLLARHVRSARQKTALKVFFSLTTLWCIAFNMAISFTGYYDHFRTVHPELYGLLTRLF